MAASQQVTRHAIHIHSHRLLIQQIVLQLKALNPRVVDDLYEKISAEFDSAAAKKTKRLQTFETQVNAHIAELLSGAEGRAG